MHCSELALPPTVPPASMVPPTPHIGYRLIESNIISMDHYLAVTCHELSLFAWNWVYRTNKLEEIIFVCQKA